MNPIRTTLLADCLSGARSVGPSMSVRARDRVEGSDDEDDGDAGQAADQGDDDRDDGANWRDRVLTGNGARLRVGHVLPEGAVGPSHNTARPHSMRPR